MAPRSLAGEESLEFYLRRCVWARTGGDRGHFGPHPLGQNQQYAYMEGSLGKSSPASQPLCGRRLAWEREQGSGGHWPALLQGLEEALSLPVTHAHPSLPSGFL